MCLTKNACATKLSTSLRHILMQILFLPCWVGGVGWGMTAGFNAPGAFLVNIETTTRKTACACNIANSVNCDRPGGCSPEKDCLRWHWLMFWQPERKSSSESSGSDNDFCSGCWKVSQCHLKQSFSGLHSPGRSQFTKLWYDSYRYSFTSNYIKLVLPIWSFPLQI